MIPIIQTLYSVVVKTQEFLALLSWLIFRFFDQYNVFCATDMFDKNDSTVHEASY